MSVQKNVIRACLGAHRFAPCLLYEFKLGSNATEALQKMFTAFGKNAVTDRTVRICVKKFALGETLKYAPRAGLCTAR